MDKSTFVDAMCVDPPEEMGGDDKALCDRLEKYLQNMKETGCSGINRADAVAYLENEKKKYDNQKYLVQIEELEAQMDELGEVDKAVSYTHLGVKEEPGYVSYMIEDEGTGMNPGDLAHIFDRFYRSDEARNNETGGSGLGLSIAKWIVDAHGGTIQVISRADIGSRFVAVSYTHLDVYKRQPPILVMCLQSIRISRSCRMPSFSECFQISSRFLWLTEA